MIFSETRARDHAQTADTEPLDQRLVAPLIVAPEIIEQLSPLRNELEQAASRMVVVDVGLEMLGEAGDSFGQDRNLNFRRPGVAGCGGIVFDDFGLAAGTERHRLEVLSKAGAL